MMDVLHFAAAIIGLFGPVVVCYLLGRNKNDDDTCNLLVGYLVSIFVDICV